MHPFDFIESINDRVTEYVAKMQEVLPEDLGLDRRAGYRFYVDKDMTTIVTPKYRDNSLQYYGGFEYVDEDCRKELGNWVFYSDNDDRVAEALAYYNAEEGESNAA